MHISIRDIRSIERADFSAVGVTLIAGRNRMGKSSILSTTALALTGQNLPAGMSKGDAGQLVRVGASVGSIKISGHGEGGKVWSVGVAYPKLEPTVDGRPPKMSAYAAGLATICDLPEKQLSDVMSAYLGTVPTKENLSDQMTDAGFSQTAIDKVWETISADGWDAVHRKAVTHGATLKGQWQDITGRQKYGKKIAESWLPEGWTNELGEASLDGLEAAITKARADTEAQVAQGAVSGEQRAALAAQVAQLETLRAALAGAQEAKAAADQMYNDARQARDALPLKVDANGPEGVHCAHCGAANVISIVDGKTTLVVPPPPLTEAQVKKARSDIAGADGALSRTKGAADAAARGLFEAEKALKAAEDAQTQLAAMGDGQGDETALNRAREAERAAQARRDTFVAYTNATTKHKGIERNQALIDILAPEGLRRRVMAKAVETFNADRLAPLCAAAGWKPVTVSEDLSIALGGRLYGILSTSEKYRVRAVLQVAMAQIDKSACVVLDDAEVLDAEHREGLVKMLKSSQVEALVGMTYNLPRQVPDFAKIGGASYWVDEGTVVTVSDAVARAQEAA